MWRFLLSALALMTAVLVLFAGALGGLRPLSILSETIRALAEDRASGTAALASPAPAPAVVQSGPSVAEQQAMRDALQWEDAGSDGFERGAIVRSGLRFHAEDSAQGSLWEERVADLQRQAGELQAQIAQHTQELAQRMHDLDAARAEADKLRQDIGTLHQQRQTEQASLARQKAREQNVAAAAAPRSPGPSPISQAIPSAPPPSASQQLFSARQWLAAGRPDEARRLLAMAQTQMVLQPVTPEQAVAQGGNPSATDIGDAIRWLDIGARGQAMLAINHAIDSVDTAAAGGWPRYPPPASGYYSKDAGR
jgi:hypothetical protein